MTTVTDILQHYQAFNDWELTEKKRILPGLSITKSLDQYYQLWAMHMAIKTDDEGLLALQVQNWLEYHETYIKLIKSMGYEDAYKRITGHNELS
ncbi:MAG: hypothetical protein B6242_00980 [Anaerolineaceae bacterium 4572_78]|nr:MAG: hypothetical protein B6242_00980 [Anaerolineaceae bacterium 4572_78]